MRDTVTNVPGALYLFSALGNISVYIFHNYYSSFLHIFFRRVLMFYVINHSWIWQLWQSCIQYPLFLMHAWHSYICVICKGDKEQQPFNKHQPFIKHCHGYVCTITTLIIWSICHSSVSEECSRDDMCMDGMSCINRTCLCLYGEMSPEANTPQTPMSGL